MRTKVTENGVNIPKAWLELAEQGGPAAGIGLRAGRFRETWRG